MIYITPNIFINESEIKWHFIRSSGPGGQNVNKVATAVQLRLDTHFLPEGVRSRLKILAGKRLTSAGELIITAQRYRTQEKNRQDALYRLIELIRKAAEKPKVRRKTKPTLNSKKRRLEKKKQRSKIKKLRARVMNKE
jgi:ribosome-associated protein